jgi:hypothetical protein
MTDKPHTVSTQNQIWLWGIVGAVVIVIVIASLMFQ